ncbi:MAG: hypothetical protein MEQ84_03460 [Mesorhizobium sp.]|nr:hypothetical protein [Mesorhizobium sp.]
MTVIRFVFRVLATLLLAAAVVLAVVDATRSIAADAIVVTSLAEAWAQAAPDLLGDAAAAVGEGGLPFAEGLFESLLAVPAVAILAILALLFYIMGRNSTRRAGRYPRGA